MRILKTCLIISLSFNLLACGSGGGGSSTNNSSTTTYQRLTPASGLSIPLKATIDNLNQVESNNYYTSLVSNDNILYAATADGRLLKLASPYTNWQTALTLDNGQTINALGANLNNAGVYYAQDQSDQILSYPVSSTLTSTIGNISAITSSNNGSVYFATSSGNIGLINNPANKLINTSLDSSYITMAIACTSNSCNSGQQGLLAFQTESKQIPAFESSIIKNEPQQYHYSSVLYYLNHGSWIKASYNPIISTNNSVTIESVTYSNVPEFVTAIMVDTQKSKLYIGTNLFNIYSSNLNCNNGQGCTINFSQTSDNAQPLANVTNGSQGISNLSLLNGNIYAVANYSESVIGLYSSHN
ncbi:MAG: hypothetical protein RLZZ293_149 [Pseudomonadota bacterium]|jgi:hypothetical protein